MQENWWTLDGNRGNTGGKLSKGGWKTKSNLNDRGPVKQQQIFRRQPMNTRNNAGTWGETKGYRRLENQCRQTDNK